MTGAPSAGADYPHTLNDEERAAWDRLGGEQFWHWARRGQWDPPQSWEVEQ